ncbi:MAG TPA: translocation/assembly module TamB domain-containing protein, partial [Candidatus Methanoperedens sp.]|nr:translocation/assembly module TamB domain-containing protein [Candidatus Methanoperedens sp.]
QGTVDYAGRMLLQGEVTAALGPLATFLDKPAVSGTARFSGKASGRWDAPELAGDLALSAPVYRGRAWPDARGTVAWAGRRLSWSDVRVAAGRGALTLTGSADFSAPRPRYQVEARAQAAELARLAPFAGKRVEPVLGLDGTLRWEGSGSGADADGAGSLEAKLRLAPWPDEELALSVRATRAGGALAIDVLRLAGATLEASGKGAWRAGGGFTGSVSGAVADIARLQPTAHRGQVALGGSGSFAGAVEADGGDPRFTGTVRLARTSVGKLHDLDADARIVLTPASLRLVECALAWPGGRGGVQGTIDLASGGLALDGTLADLSLPEGARLLDADPAQFAGRLAATLSVRGTLAAPVIAGRVSGKELRFRKAVADTATLSFTYASRRLVAESLRLRRGKTELIFSGELRDGRVLEGTFESPAFDAADVIPGSRLDLAGSLQGRVAGPLAALELEGTARATRLRYGGFDFRGGELAVKYAGGKAALTGWVAAPENRLRAVVEPAQGWRFESELDLRQLAPELVRSGSASFPPGLAKLVGEASFLAAGKLSVRGRLREPDSVAADLVLETFWLQASGQTLQNRAPVRVLWREGGLKIEDFRLAGEQYRLDLAGTGHTTAGWDLRAAGTVDLAFFTAYWPELEQVDGTGDLDLTLRGPWAAPAPEGNLAVHGAFVKARSLPEPLERLTGRVELRGRTLRALDVEGTIAGGPFRGRGSYGLATGEIDAEVEGRLDLALFRGRIPGAREMRGQVQVRLGLRGPLAKPAFTGAVEVVDAELFVRPLPAKITHLSGKLTVGADRVEAISLTGQTGGGTIALSGSLVWGPPGRADLELRGEGILVTLAEGLKAQADVALGLHGEPAALKLAGEVRILKARYLREFTERPPLLVPARSAAAGEAAAPAGAGPDLSRTALDVKVRATDNVWIANRMAKIEAAVALDIGGTLAAPAVRGEITAIRGEAFYLSRQFRLESGTLRFAPPGTVPLLDLQASTTVGETQILFLMDGPLNKLSYHLVSLPALSQEDLVALLTIGETRTGLSRRGERGSSVGAAVFTTEPLVNALGDEARSSMGLEVLQLEPIVGDDNKVSARLTLGTRLSDRMYVSYSQNLGATEDQQVAVQYYLLDYLSLWGQELRQGIYSLDLVFRYSFK